MRSKYYILLCAFFLLFAPAGKAQSNNTKLLFAIDGLAPALKVGIQKHYSERFYVQGSAGFCLVGPSLLSWNFFGTYLLTKPEKPWGLNVHFGLLDNYVDVLTPTYSLGLGAAAGLRYKFQNQSSLNFRLGIISGPSIDNKKFDFLTIPNFGIEYAFPMKPEKRKQ
ncbi:MAG: hypothetical protein JXR22_04995 [Prolixibacteraceae bacterium]|nr:hypothetical protein [Prolixibacteraceae bacterium]